MSWSIFFYRVLHLFSSNSPHADNVIFRNNALSLLLVFSTNPGVFKKVTNIIFLVSLSRKI